MLHGLIEYVIGMALIVAPFALAFEAAPATAVSIIGGLVVLVLAAVTAGPTGIVKQVPVSVHVVIDFLLVPVLIAAPFLFGFSDERAPTTVFIGLAVFHLLLTIGTRFAPKEASPEEAARRDGGAPKEAGAPKEPGAPKEGGGRRRGGAPPEG